MGFIMGVLNLSLAWPGPFRYERMGWQAGAYYRVRMHTSAFSIMVFLEVGIALACFFFSYIAFLCTRYLIWQDTIDARIAGLALVLEWRSLQLDLLTDLLRGG
jgi:hypothetical protein